MDTLKDKIINQLISILSKERDKNPDEINQITIDLLNNKLDSLINFVKNNYNNVSFSSEIKNFVKQLTDKDLIDKSYLEIIKTPFELIQIQDNNILFESSKPLNVKESTLNKILNNINSTIEENNNTQYDDKYEEINFNIGNEKKLNNILETENDDFLNNSSSFNQDNESNQDNIDKLRKTILETQLNYINDANSFIQTLEHQDVNNLYNTLMDLNDIRFIQHSLSKLSFDTLNNLLEFVEDKYNNNKHTSIDMFIIEVIKKNLHSKMH